MKKKTIPWLLLYEISLKTFLLFSSIVKILNLKVYSNTYMPDSSLIKDARDAPIVTTAEAHCLPKGTHVSIHGVISKVSQ